MAQRQAVTKKKAPAYKGDDRAGKSRVLGELVELTGRYRDYAGAALRDALVLKIVKPPRGRTPVYGPELLRYWAVLRALTGRLLAPSQGPAFATLPDPHGVDVLAAAGGYEEEGAGVPERVEGRQELTPITKARAVIRPPRCVSHVMILRAGPRLLWGLR